MRLPTHLSLRIAACLSVALLSAGCSSSDARARDALSDYQSAAAANDLVGARRALLKLVQAKDDVPDYWVELGKLEASTGSYSDAYYAFSRAYELDRTNVDILRAVTQLALRAGDLPSALKHADELEVVAPGDPWPKIAKGWAALRESRFDQALAAADSILAASPYDPSAITLKGRALIGLNRSDEAKSLLIKQTQDQPSDVGSFLLLGEIYQRERDWAKVLPVAQRLVQLSPADSTYGLMAVEAGFRSGRAAEGRSASMRLLKPDAPASLVNSVLSLWEQYWPSQERLSDARRLAGAAANLPSRLAYAKFLGRLGSPADTVRLSAPAATLPINAGNAEANAVLGDAWWRMGNAGPAKARLDAVLTFDPGNATALRSRAELFLRLNNPQAAIADAQKVTTSLPTSAPDRILLARSYAAAGNKGWVDRTLWSAFQDIPGDERLFAQLQARRNGDPDATRQLQEEFDRQRDAKISRGLM